MLWFALGLPVALVLALELRWRLFKPDQLELTATEWHCDREADHFRITGTLEAHNANAHQEVMLVTLTPELVLLGSADIAGIHHSIKIRSSVFVREDNYWQATILEPLDRFPIAVEITIQGEGLEQLKSAWLKLHYTQYGRQPRQLKSSHVIWPLAQPKPMQIEDWQLRGTAKVMPVRTHLLTPLDTLAGVTAQYVQPWAQAGDYLALAESAVAIVEGNFRHHTAIKPGFLARRLCYAFDPKSSLASATGMQALIDSSHPLRVLAAFIVGVLAKLLLRKKGVFYELAGWQAPLIDDVTGTLPPYEQFLVYGPDQPQKTVDDLKAATGLEVAIVDVNDLKRVKIVAKTTGIVPETLTQALLDNPAGNAAEQTPLVLIRP